MIVIDTSALSKFLMREENWEKVVPHLDPTLKPHTIDILLVEGTNVIWKYTEKYKSITVEQAFGLYEQMMKLANQEVMIVEPSKKYLKKALEISIECDITIYDSLFLAQAKTLNARLTTSDKTQEKAAKKIDLDVTYIE
ncbi:MAG: type II toxin-antitoxin system VapC family toxin [Candidatus Freyarchaeota archaeon]